MDKDIKVDGFLGYLLDDEKLVEKGSQIIKALLEAQSPRLSNLPRRWKDQARVVTKPSNDFWGRWI